MSRFLRVPQAVLSNSLAAVHSCDDICDGYKEALFALATCEASEFRGEGGISPSSLESTGMGGNDITGCDDCEGVGAGDSESGGEGVKERKRISVRGILIRATTNNES